MTRACEFVASHERIWLTPEVKDEEAKVAKRQQRVHKRKRFILVDREHGNVLGDTGYDCNGQPAPRISGLPPSRPQRCCRVAAQPITIPTAIAW